MLIRRLSIVASAAATAIALTAGSASAPLLLISDPNADEGRAGSSGFRMFESIAVEFTGLCPVGSKSSPTARGSSWTR